MPHPGPVGRYSQGIEESGPALVLDPISPIVHDCIARVIFRGVRYDEAIGAAREALELDPSFVNRARSSDKPSMPVTCIDHVLSNSRARAPSRFAIS